MNELSLETEQRRRPVLLFWGPVVVFTGLAVALGWGLTRDPKVLPSALIDKPVPEFNLPPVKGRTFGLASVDLVGEVSIVNVFASWCLPCKAEHPVWMGLQARNGVPIHGLNYKDTPEDASAWLNRLGDPYKRTGADLDGRVAIDWGVYGVPETFIVSADGRIAYKHVGAVTKDIVYGRLMPIVDRLRREIKGAKP
ncbi:DsbE family thiol:disulfide interchange protein [Thalassospiraceae bacterium LMO-SO8]|nr:DsbE family thiol:disulfide interchange protein [Alphaproteobacteria bacterium LMO-S08]WND75138.1 DsbE family thiol:disulfide interchange protein [Thalassospiraceae bacterium LMO-SO8]